MTFYVGFGSVGSRRRPLTFGSLEKLGIWMPAVSHRDVGLARNLLSNISTPSLGTFLKIQMQTPTGVFNFPTLLLIIFLTYCSSLTIKLIHNEIRNFSCCTFDSLIYSIFILNLIHSLANINQDINTFRSKNLRK